MVCIKAEDIQEEPVPVMQKARKRIKKKPLAQNDVNCEDNHSDSNGEQFERSEDIGFERIPLLFCLRSCDGLKLQIGDIVKADDYSAPLIICGIWDERSRVSAKLCKFDVTTNRIVEDFVVNCNVNFLSIWDGDKIRAKSAADTLFAAASEQVRCFLQSHDSGILRLYYRKAAVSRALRDSIVSGFSNLTSSRCSLGPFDMFCDSIIFGLGDSASRRFSLLENGDFSFLDKLMGGKWDIKLGKDEGSFFKYVIQLEIVRSRDFILVCNVKFSESNFPFCDNYRSLCKNSIIERRREMAVNQ